jgi:hypothetical protein
MESSSNSYPNKESTDAPIVQARSVYDFYEGYKPEDVTEILLPDFGRGIAIGPYGNIWFFTRC